MGNKKVSSVAGRRTEWRHLHGPLRGDYSVPCSRSHESRCKNSTTVDPGRSGAHAQAEAERRSVHSARNCLFEVERGDIATDRVYGRWIADLGSVGAGIPYV